MKTIKILTLILCTGIGLSCKENDPVYPAPADTQIVGKWTLVRVINGFSQISKTPAELGYAETIDFTATGTYQRVRTGTSPENEKATFYTGDNPTKTGEKQAVFYPTDRTVQPYSLRDGHLFLYERGSQDATIFDGSTYEYSKQ